MELAYDASSRLSTVKDGAGHTLATYTYDSLDRVTQAALGNSTTVTPSYDLLNRVISVVNALGGSTTRNYGYVYDDAGRCTSLSDPRGTVATSYDNRNEVTGITEPSGSPFSDQAFAYDAAFNRSGWTKGTTTTSFTANNLNQYTAVGSATPTYTADGELSSYAGNAYVYDALGRLTSVTTSAGTTTYSYDPFGRRIKKVSTNTSGTVLATYQYHYDGSAVAVEYRPEATWTYYGGVLRTDGTNNQYYYRDGKGSVSAVADNSGDILESYEYTTQGHCQITNGTGSVIASTAIGNDLLYSGYRYDTESGNYYCNARYYNPYLGRFLSRDPLGGAEFSQGTNLYAYCGNDFANEFDPSGTTGEMVLIEMGGAFGQGNYYLWQQTKPSAQVSSGGPNSLHNAAQIVAGAGLVANGMQFSYAKLGTNGNFYFKEMARGNGSYRIAINITKIGKALGPAGAVVGTGFDIAQGVQGTESPTMVGVNVYMAGVGIFGGPPGEIAAGVFFTGEFAYDMIEGD